MSELTMPSFGADMDAGTLIEWLIKVGDSVKKDDVVAVVETQKGAIEMEAFAPGVVRELLVDEGTEVPVGTPIALIDDGLDTANLEPSAIVSEPHSELIASTPLSSSLPSVITSVKASVELPLRHLSHSEGEAISPYLARIKASPLAKRLAAEQGVDLNKINGSGPGGAVMATDFNKASINPAPAVSSGINMNAMRSAIAAAMVKSKREIPHYYLETTIDLQTSVDWLACYNDERPAQNRILMSALLHKAVALALTKSPALNGLYKEGVFIPLSSVHLGTVVSIRGGGLIAPAILNAGTLSLPDMMHSLLDLSDRVRSGRLRSSELSEATVTVTSMGDRGVEKVFGVIYPPQVAIIGLGKPVQRPWVIDDQVEARSLLTVTLSADHRVSDGRQGAKFLMQLDKLLQKPECL